MIIFLLNLEIILFLKKIIKNIKKEKFVIKIDVEGVEENVIKELIKSNILKNAYSIFVRNSKRKFNKKN